MKKIKQFVFYGNGDHRNVPNDNDKWKYNLLRGYGAVSHLGIQGSPEILFCLNNSSDKDAISIGGTGVYEIDLNGVGYISSLRFIWDKLIENYTKNGSRRLIVDIIYEEAN